uniref:Uncharacterized protein n=1 Tax=Arundo donax TaxID=35708 RepID=A0A0A9EKW5_ARUDO
MHFSFISSAVSIIGRIWSYVSVTQTGGIDEKCIKTGGIDGIIPNAYLSGYDFLCKL